MFDNNNSEVKQQNMDYLKTLQQNIKQAKTEYKLAKQKAKVINRLIYTGPSRLQKVLDVCEKGLDKTALVISKPFVKMNESIQYKLVDPEGYEADGVVSATDKALRYFRRKISKGKKFDTKEITLLNQLSLAINLVVSSNRGVFQKRAISLKDEIEKMLTQLNGNV